jgi:HSP20 family protein
MNALVTRRLFAPRTSFGDLSREIDSLFEGVFGSRPNRSDADWTPHVESYVKDETLHVRADLPGVDPKAVEVTVEDDILTIRGERKTEHEEAAYREVRYGRFERRLRVPEGTEPDKITARYTNGVLEIGVPIPKPVSRKVTVDVATA